MFLMLSLGICFTLQNSVSNISFISILHISKMFQSVILYSYRFSYSFSYKICLSPPHDFIITPKRKSNTRCRHPCKNISNFSFKGVLLISKNVSNINFRFTLPIANVFNVLVLELCFQLQN